MSIVVIDYLMVKIIISIFKLGKCTLKKGVGQEICSQLQFLEEGFQFLCSLWIKFLFTEKVFSKSSSLYAQRFNTVNAEILN